MSRIDFEPGRAKPGVRIASALGAFLLYALAVPWLLRPWFASGNLLPHAAGPIGAMADADLLLNLWILAWTAHTALVDPMRLFDGNIYHPAPGAILGSENMLGHLPVTAPLLVLMDGDALRMFEGFLVESFALAGLGMFLYVRHHTRSFPAALFAGAAYTFTAFRVQTLPQPQYLGSAWLPLALLFVDLWLEQERRCWLVGLASALALQALSCVYLGFFALIGVPIYALVRLCSAPHPLRSGVGLALAGAVATSALLPAAWPYLAARAQGRIPAFDIALIRPFSWMPWQYASLEFLSRMGPVTLGILLLGGVSNLARRAGLGQSPSAADPGKGTALRVVNGPFSRVNFFSPIAGLTAMALVAVLLSAGPDLGLPGGSVLPLPYRLLHAFVPGFSSIRVPIRFSLLVASALAALAGFAAAKLLARLSRGRALLTALLLVAACVWTAAPRPSATMPSGIGTSAAPAHLWLVRNVGIGPVLEIPGPTDADDPIGNLRNARAMVASTLGFWSLLNGYTAYPPPAAGLVAAAVRDLPEPHALQRLVDLTGLRWILVRRETLAPAEKARWAGPLPEGIVSVAHFGNDEILQITLTPAEHLESELVARSASPPLLTLDGTPRSPLAPICTEGISLRDVQAPDRVTRLPLPIHVPLTIANDSTCALPAADARVEGLVVLRHRWHSPDGQVIASRLVSRLAYDVPAGTHLPASLLIVPPGGATGKWRLEVILAQQGRAEPLAQFFSDVQVGAADPAASRNATGPG